METKTNAYKILLILFLDILLVVITHKIPFLIIAFAIFILTFIFLKNNILYAINLLILCHVFIIKSTKELSVFEVFTGLLLIYIIVNWIYQTKFADNKILFKTKTEFWLMFFLSTCFFSVIPAVIYSSSLLKWTRELIPFLTLFLFFPLQAYSKPKHIQFLLIPLFIISFVVSIQNIYLYKTAMSDIKFAWEVLSSRETANEPLLFVSVILSVGFFNYFNKKSLKILSIASILLFGISLFLTFTRGYWIATILALSVIYILSNKNIKKKLLLQFAIIGFIAVFSLQFFFSNIGEILVETIVSRFTSVGTALTDVSFQNRIVESKAVLELVKNNPIMGYGLGKTYIFNPIIPREMPTWYVHNAYLFLWFKLGFLGLASFLIFYFTILIHGFHLSIKNKTNNFTIIINSMNACLISMLLVSITSPQFIQKDSMLIITLFAAIIEFFYQRNLEQK